jgi:soluble lytic murein transglycosylase-like protein
MKPRLLRPLLLGALLHAAAAHADIFGYLDADGGAHFSTEKIDERYQLFARREQSFDSSQLSAPAMPSPGTGLLNYLTQHPNLKKFEALLNQAANDFSIEPALLKAVMAAESGFNPQAMSPKGAIGLMQVMPATAERYGLQADKKQTLEQKLRDPKTNIRLAARYLRDLIKMFPNHQELIVASYNAGEGAVQKYRNQIPPYPETRNYVKLVTQFYYLYKPQSIQVGGHAITAPGSRRIHLTLPGRRELPNETVR